MAYSPRSYARKMGLLQIAETLNHLQRSGQVQFFNTGSGFLLPAGRRLGLAASPDLFEIGLEDFELTELYEYGEELGSGISAIVDSVTLKTTGAKAAVKAISKSSEWWLKGQQKRRIETTIREISLLETIVEQNITGVTRIFAVIETAREVLLLMELCTGGDLMQILREDAELNIKSNKPCGWGEDRAAFVLRGVARTLTELHQLNIIHRDVKPENILLVNDDPLSETRLTDFGLSHTMQNKMLTSFVGTRNFMAPEMLQKDRAYTSTVDLWGLGVVMYTLLSTKVPFFCEGGSGSRSTEVFLELIEQGPEFVKADWVDKSPEAQEVISSLLRPDPEQRMTAAQFLQSQWVQKFAAQWEQDAELTVEKSGQEQLMGSGGLLRSLLCCLPRRVGTDPAGTAAAAAAPRIAPMRQGVTTNNALHDSKAEIGRWIPPSETEEFGLAAVIPKTATVAFKMKAPELEPLGPLRDRSPAKPVKREMNHRLVDSMRNPSSDVTVSEDHSDNLSDLYHSISDRLTPTNSFDGSSVSSDEVILESRKAQLAGSAGGITLKKLERMGGTMVASMDMNTRVAMLYRGQKSVMAVSADDPMNCSRGTQGSYEDTSEQSSSVNSEDDDDEGEDGEDDEGDAWVAAIRKRTLAAAGKMRSTDSEQYTE